MNIVLLTCYIPLFTAAFIPAFAVVEAVWHYDEGMVQVIFLGVDNVGTELKARS